MDTIFGRNLLAAMKARGISGNKMSGISGVPNPTLRSLIHGRRPPSEANLRSLAAVTELSVTYEQLRAWADMDRMGKDGLENMVKAGLFKPGDDLADAVLAALNRLWEPLPPP